MMNVIERLYTDALRRCIVQGSVLFKVGSALKITRIEIKADQPVVEFNLLFKLLSYPGKIFTRQQLMDEIWGMDSEMDEFILRKGAGIPGENHIQRA